MNDNEIALHAKIFQEEQLNRMAMKGNVNAGDH